MFPFQKASVTKLCILCFVVISLFDFQWKKTGYPERSVSDVYCVFVGKPKIGLNPLRSPDLKDGLTFSDPP
jgi:hypothetical protein